MTIGSLFDGIGGFMLAAVRNGIKPIWSSEIEPKAEAVTKHHFPAVIQYGDITKMDGAQIEPVDIISFGSPCQDLSVAGKRAGIHDGERSNLFFEAIRIIEEMREATNGLCPRFAIWENVPGAFSSNSGDDFQAVLQALANVKDQTADVPRSPTGKWHPAGSIMGNGWSVAWRTLNAQFWGVPQRRKRIFAIADFRGQSASKILFKPQGMRRDTQARGTAGEGAADNAEGSVRGSGVRCLNPWDCQSKRQYRIDGAYRTLDAGNSAGGQAHGVCYPIDLIRESRGAFEVYEEDAQAAGSLKQSDYKGTQVVCFKERAGCPGGGKGILCGDDAFTLSAVQQRVCYGIRTAHTSANGIGVSEEVSHTLDAAGSVDSVVYSVDCRNMNLTKDHGTLQAKENGGQSLNYMGAGCYPVDNHPNDSRMNLCEDGVVPTLSSRMGTGGNNGPMVLEVEPVVYAGVGVTSKANGQNPQPGDPCPTLHNDSRNYLVDPVVNRIRGFGDYEQDDTCSAVKARDYKDATDLVCEKKGRKYVIRRLTPMECERLQGFPDRWTDIPYAGKPMADSARYKMLGNSVAIPCVEFVMHQIAEVSNVRNELKG